MLTLSTITLCVSLPEQKKTTITTDPRYVQVTLIKPEYTNWKERLLDLTGSKRLARLEEQLRVQVSSFMPDYFGTKDKTIFQNVKVLYTHGGDIVSYENSATDKQVALRYQHALDHYAKIKQKQDPNPIINPWAKTVGCLLPSMVYLAKTGVLVKRGDKKNAQNTLYIAAGLAGLVVAGKVIQNYFIRPARVFTTAQTFSSMPIENEEEMKNRIKQNEEAFEKFCQKKAKAY